MGNSLIKGAIYVVATPIGNFDDITLRAIETLKNVDLIAAEDTRTTSVLLEHFGIETKLSSYHKFSECEKTNSLIEFLKEGNNLALVSDAGTPLISDPGGVLIKSAIENNIKIIPIGGISAVVTFLSTISKDGEDFKFVGFLPKIKNQIEKVLEDNKFENLIFYESPKRIKETIDIIEKLNPKAIFSIGRELTKKFEEIKTGNISEIKKYYETNTLKGEIVCMVHKSKENKEDEKIKQKVKLLKKEGFSLKDTVKILNITDSINKNKIKEFFID